MADFFTARQQKASKPYECEVCSKKISSGTKYEYRFWKDGGSTYYSRMHLECADAVDDYCRENDYDEYELGAMRQNFIEENLYSEFDIEKHKHTFVDYFEAVIMENGTVQYAVPSHQEKLIKIGMMKYRKTREDFIKTCPREMYCDYMEWLCEVTGCVAVWGGFAVGKPNQYQMNKINELIDAEIISPRVLSILNGGQSNG